MLQRHGKSPNQMREKAHRRLGSSGRQFREEA